jgi:hypothetical protein
MASSSQRKKQDELRNALDKGENPLSSEEINFKHTCRPILKVDSEDKMTVVATMAEGEGKSNPACPNHRKSSETPGGTRGQGFYVAVLRLVGEAN